MRLTAPRPSRTRHALRHRGVLVALEEGEVVPLAVLAAREPADLRNRLLLLRLAAELAHLREIAVDVVAAEVDARPRHSFHAVDAAALAVLLPHQVLHAGHAGIVDLPAAYALPELPAALEILRGKLEVHNPFAHEGPPLRVKLYAPTVYDEGEANGSRDRPVRAGAERSSLRAARRALPQRPWRDVPARQGLRCADGRAAVRLLRGMGVARHGRVQVGCAQRRVHGDRQGRDGDGRQVPRDVRRR